MSEFLKKNLQENEKIVWQDKPADIKLLEPPFKTSIMISWCFCALFFIVILVYLKYASSSDLSFDTALKVSGIIFLCIILAFFSPVMDINRLKSKYRYYITNQRFIILKEGSDSSMDWRDFSDVNEVGLDILSTGNAAIYINPIGYHIANKARKGIASKRTENYKGETMFFYSVKEYEKAIDAIPSEILITKNWSKKSKK